MAKLAYSLTKETKQQIREIVIRNQGDRVRQEVVAVIKTKPHEFRIAQILMLQELRKQEDAKISKEKGAGTR